MSRALFDCGEVRGDRLAWLRDKDVVDVGGTIDLKDLLERLREEELHRRAADIYWCAP